MLEQFKILLKIQGNVRNLRGKEKPLLVSKVPWLHQTPPKSGILYHSCHFVFVSIKVPMDIVFRNYHARTLAKRSKSNQIV